MRLDTPEDVESLRRSIAMLAPGAPALDSHDAALVLGRLGNALSRVRALEARVAELERGGGTAGMAAQPPPSRGR